MIYITFLSHYSQNVASEKAGAIKIQFLIVLLLLIPLLSTCTFQMSGSAGGARPNAFVKVLQQTMTSQFSPGMSNVDTSLFSPWDSNNQAAVQRAKALAKEGLSFINQPILGWGSDDPWPDPDQKEPDNWTTLDQKIRIALETQTTPVITLCSAPWWMLGQLQADGTTKLLSREDEFTATAMNSRILDNKMDDWLLLVQRVAERYMPAPYNVRYFQVWNELKGYYNPITNNWDISNNAGHPQEAQARHGYTYMYNRVYNTLKNTATAIGIAPQSIKVGGPYVVMNTWSNVSMQSAPSHLTKAYGNYDQRDLDALTYWLRHKTGAEFIAIDGNNNNRDGRDNIDPFKASEKFADMVHWIRGLHEPGARSLPIWWAEWYADAGTGASSQAATALKAYAMIKLLKAGGSVALEWGSSGEGEQDSSGGLWTSTSDDDGGNPLPWYYEYKALKTYFGPGTLIYQTRSSPTVEALVSPTTSLLVNKTAQPLRVSFMDTTIDLSPYAVRLINTPTKPTAIFNHSRGQETKTL